MSPDARKTLPMLVDEWMGCTKCSLSTHRETNRGMMVFGEGRQRGILFLGEGPGATEEAYGRPFIGKSGELLRLFLERYKIKNHYITNVVACRSCAPVLDEYGQPRLTRAFGNRPQMPKYQDQPPLKDQMEACAPRVYEEIYMADPVLIVALGGPAATFLRGSNVKITQERGVPVEVEVPGAGFRPILSDKKKEWARKVKGQLVMPVEQSVVRYLMLPTLHPAFVLRNKHDEKDNNPFQQFARDIELAKMLYNRQYIEITGMVPDDYEEDASPDEVPYDILDQLEREE